MLELRPLGKNRQLISVLGLGTWAFGGPWQYGWGYQDDRDSEATLEAAWEKGLNWLDTAPAYGLGHAEELVGRFLEHKREKFFIATKCGIIWDQKGRVRININPGSISQQLDASLKRLKTDYIDLYQIHWPDKTTPLEKVWEKMLDFKRRGKIRFAGVSNFSLAQLKVCLKVGPVDSIQPAFNLLRREVERELLPFCFEQGIAVLTYSPLMSGLLSGQFDPSRLAPDDWRRNSPYFKEPLLGKIMLFLKALEPLAAKYERPLLQFCLGWVLQNRAVTAAIVGARRPRQLDDLVSAVHLKLAQVDCHMIDALSQNILGDLHYQAKGH